MMIHHSLAMVVEVMMMQEAMEMVVADQTTTRTRSAPMVMVAVENTIAESRCGLHRPDLLAALCVRCRNVKKHQQT